MHIAALVIALIACVAIIAIGTRFLLQPQQATTAFGVAGDNLRALTAIKGVRDIASGIVPLVVWAASDQTVFGWVLVAAALTPSGDALIVIRERGSLAAALGIHALTAGVLVAVGLVLALA